MEELKRYENGNEESRWWIKYYQPEELFLRIKDKMVPARNASERIRWAGNFDLMAASILYNANFILCVAKSKIEREKELMGLGTHKWEVYTPKQEEKTVS